MKHFFLLLATLVSTTAVLSAQSSHNHKPAEGCVSDASTAIAIAQIILKKTYGEDNMARQMPLTASIKSGIWTVEGTLPKNHVGGVALIEIRKDDGKILRVTHGK